MVQAQPFGASPLLETTDWEAPANFTNIAAVLGQSGANNVTIDPVKAFLDFKVTDAAVAAIDTGREIQFRLRPVMFMGRTAYPYTNGNDS
jgi:hypothetical protein